MRKPPKYCHGYIDCRGKPRWYLRRPGFKQVPLPGLPWSPEFMAAYEAAMAGAKIEPGKNQIKAGSIADVITIYYQTAAFTRLSDTTRQTYRGILERFRADYGEHPVASKIITLPLFSTRKPRPLRRRIICATGCAR
jgi:hypothetical protein